MRNDDFHAIDLINTYFLVFTILEHTTRERERENEKKNIKIYTHYLLSLSAFVVVYIYIRGSKKFVRHLRVDFVFLFLLLFLILCFHFLRSNYSSYFPLSRSSTLAQIHMKQIVRRLLIHIKCEWGHGHS